MTDHAYTCTCMCYQEINFPKETEEKQLALHFPLHVAWTTIQHVLYISISMTCSLQAFQATCPVLKPTSHKQAKCVNTRKDNYTSSLTFMHCFKKSSIEMT